ncbi:UNVERIFIED_CONTAM: hypothetical protein K2H54_040045 [Gekko kuhli]
MVLPPTVPFKRERKKDPERPGRDYDLESLGRDRCLEENSGPPCGWWETNLDSRDPCCRTCPVGLPASTWDKIPKLLTVAEKVVFHHVRLLPPPQHHKGKAALAKILLLRQLLTAQGPKPL